MRDNISGINIHGARHNFPARQVNWQENLIKIRFFRRQKVFEG